MHFFFRRFFYCFCWTSLLGGVALVLVGCNEGAQSEAAIEPSSSLLEPIAFHEPWMGGRWLWYRPGNGDKPEINPPRFSWPLVPAGLPRNDQDAGTAFRFQMAKDSAFREVVVVEETTGHNFWSPRSTLEPGRYYWRVGYGVASQSVDRWSATRWFEIDAATPEWQRPEISDTLTELAQMEHPRLQPPGGMTWEAWGEKLRSQETGLGFLQRLRHATDKVRGTHWWKQMPSSDAGMNERRAAEFIKALGWAIFLGKLDGTPTPVEAKNGILQVAAYPKGGPTSPEYHGAKQKWSTAIPTSLALAYTLMRDELTEEERRQILDAIGWRLEAIYESKMSWRSPSGIALRGVGGAPESHPFQNFSWALPAVLLTVGDLPVSDRIAPVVLDYLASVTNAHGPEEGWNEAGRYIFEKSTTSMEAAAWTQALLPSERVAENPFWGGFGDFLAEFQPEDVQRIGFGDYSGDLSELYTQAVTADALVFGGLLGANETCLQRARDFYKRVPPDKLPADLPTDLVAGILALTFSPEIGDRRAAEPREVLRLEKAGWMFLRGHDANGEATVLVNTLARPMGGFSHSFAADGSFLWHAHGETLVAGGGSTKYPDPFSRSSLSHNVPLINGVGQRLSDRWPEFRVAARPVAKVDHPRVTGWFSDLSAAYREPTGPQHLGHYRWMPKLKNEFGGVEDLDGYVRGIFLVDERWLVIHDEFAFAGESPGRVVSWNLQTQTDREIQVEDNGAVNLGFGRGKVEATVAVASDATVLNVQVAPGLEAMVNPFTKLDYRPVAEEALKQFRRGLVPKDLLATAVHFGLDASATRMGVTAVFDAHPATETVAKRPVVSPGRVVFPSAPGGAPGKHGFVLAFREATRTGADVFLDAGATLAQAAESNPERLSALGEPEMLDIGETIQVQWMLKENFARAESLARWVVETQGAAVSLEDGVLRVRNTPEWTTDGGTSIWLRPEVPQDFVARIRCSTVAPTELNANNLNFFTNARESNGPLQFGRPGNYPDYHKIPNYTFTFVGDFPANAIAGWSRIRKNHGFHKIAGNMEVRVEPLRDYEILLSVIDGRLRMQVDGVTVVEAVDADPLPGGRFGLRTWRSNVDYHSVEIGRPVR
jgi:hypothetical protein